LSYLLTIGYFDELHGQPKQDRSHMIASITSLSGANNGSYVINNCGVNVHEDTNEWKLDRKAKMVKAFRYTIFCQNLISSQNRQLENIKNTFQD